MSMPDTGWRMRRGANPGHTGSEEYNYFLSVIFPHDQLRIMDYNRVVKDLNGLSRDGFLKRVAENFEIAEAPNGYPYRPGAPHSARSERLTDREPLGDGTPATEPLRWKPRRDTP